MKLWVYKVLTTNRTELDNHLWKQTIVTKRDNAVVSVRKTCRKQKSTSVFWAERDCIWQIGYFQNHWKSRAIGVQGPWNLRTLLCSSSPKARNGSCLTPWTTTPATTQSSLCPSKAMIKVLNFWSPASLLLILSTHHAVACQQQQVRGLPLTLPSSPPQRSSAHPECCFSASPSWKRVQLRLGKSSHFICHSRKVLTPVPAKV